MAAPEIIQYCSLDRKDRLAIDGGDLDAGSPKGGNLVVHQCQQRRDNYGDTNVDDCRELKAEAFAEARGCLEIDIVAFEGCDDDFSLNGSMCLL